MNKLQAKAATIISGTDWDGNPTEVRIWPGTQVALRGEFGKRFDIRGPQASMCGEPECGHITYVERAGMLLGALQDHYSETHGYTPALLP